jgi:hypothetical protein
MKYEASVVRRPTIFSDANVAAPCRNEYWNVLHGPSCVERHLIRRAASLRNAREHPLWVEMGAIYVDISAMPA